MYVVMDNTLRQMLADLKAWLSASLPLLLRLFVNTVDPSPNMTTPAAFVEATYSGYVPVNLFGTFQDPFRLGSGDWFIRSAIATFQHNGGPLPNLVQGWFLTRGADVVFAHRLTAPINMDVGAEPLQILLRLRAQSRSILTCVD